MPERGEVHRLVELALGDRPVAEEAGGHLVPTLQMVGQGQPDREREPAADDGVAAEEAGRPRRRGASSRPGPGCSPRPCPRARPWRPASRCPRQRVAVLAVGGHHRVVGRERLHDPDRARLLADAEMEEARMRVSL